MDISEIQPVVVLTKPDLAVPERLALPPAPVERNLRLIKGKSLPKLTPIAYLVNPTNHHVFGPFRAHDHHLGAVEEF
jgi:hypothetical protein